MLEGQRVQVDENWSYRVVAIDPLASRREKLSNVLSVIKRANGYKGEVLVEDIENGKHTVAEWTGNIGCNAVLEVCEISLYGGPTDLRHDRSLAITAR